MSVGITMFTSSYCAHCPGLKKIFEELNEEVFGGRLLFTSLVIDQNPNHMNSAREWGIQGVPTVIIVKDGMEVERIVGTKPKAEVEYILERYIQRDLFPEPSGGESDTSGPLLCDIGGEKNGKPGSD